jgi:hypothetical protein
LYLTCRDSILDWCNPDNDNGVTVLDCPGCHMTRLAVTGIPWLVGSTPADCHGGASHNGPLSPVLLFMLTSDILFGLHRNDQVHTSRDDGRPPQFPVSSRSAGCTPRYQLLLAIHIMHSV